MNHLSSTVHKVIKTQDYDKVKTLANAIKHNANGITKHEFYWEGLVPISEGGGVAPTSNSELGKAIDNAFGSFDNFVTSFTDEIINSSKFSFCWLAYNKKTDTLEIKSSNNSDSFISNEKEVPFNL